MSKRISIYVAPALDNALTGRTSAEDGMRSRSAVIAAMAERYTETCKRHMPSFALAEWLLIFDAMTGCWTLESSAIAARSIALQVSDACTMDAAHERHGLTLEQGRDLAGQLDALDFAASVAVLDAAERFWAAELAAELAAVEGDYREPVRGLVGRLADDA